jgi:hypothetical protein
MMLFINKNDNITAIRGSVVYEIPMTLNAARTVHKLWRKPGDVRLAIEALITNSARIGNVVELQANDDPAMRMYTK